MSRVQLICAYEPCSQPFSVLPHQANIWKFCSTKCYNLKRAALESAEAFAQRFWNKVAIAGPEECWLWTAALTGQGYGNFRATPYHKGNVGAHIVSWFLTHDYQWPPDGLFVLHRCDIHPCVSPAHLWIGTQTDNMQDAIRKGRNGMVTMPEKAIEALRQWNLENPTRPQTAGDKNGMRLHPESVLRGDKSPATKITTAQWVEALELYATGQWSYTDLARRYGVTSARIGQKMRQHKVSYNI